LTFEFLIVARFNPYLIVILNYLHARIFTGKSACTRAGTAFMIQVVSQQKGQSLFFLCRKEYCLNKLNEVGEEVEKKEE
jgi:hypothetical protein